MSESPPPGAREFTTTQWSLVLAARPGAATPSEAHRALEALSRAYWYPLYAFVRARGVRPADAQDLTQAFFARVVVRGGFPGADPARGRFRSYLLSAMKHFLANEWHRARARKRGGGTQILPLDALDPEARYAVNPVSDPEAGFDREWAREVVARAQAAVRAEYESQGKGEWFDRLQPSLAGDEPPRAETAARLGITEGALKVAIHRLRKRYRSRVREEIAETVADPGEIDAEMSYLLEALRADGG